MPTPMPPPPRSRPTKFYRAQAYFSRSEQNKRFALEMTLFRRWELSNSIEDMRVWHDYHTQR